MGSQIKFMNDLSIFKNSPLILDPDESSSLPWVSCPGSVKRNDYLSSWSMVSTDLWSKTFLSKSTGTFTKFFVASKNAWYTIEFYGPNYVSFILSNILPAPFCAFLSTPGYYSWANISTLIIAKNVSIPRSAIFDWFTVSASLTWWYLWLVIKTP